MTPLEYEIDQILTAVIVNEKQLKAVKELISQAFIKYSKQGK